MKVRVQVVICTEEGQAETQYEVAVLEKDYQHIEQLGLTLAEAKHLLKQLQQHLVEHQAAAFLTRRSQCPACGLPFQIKERTTRTIRTLFGTLTLPNPRFHHCPCQPQPTTTFRPLPALLTASTTPELLFLETKWASLISYGMTARVLKDFLPLDETLNATTVQHHTLAVAQRCEEELGEELVGCEDRCPQTGSLSPRLEEPIAVGLDGGYVRAWEQKQRHFEVIVGQAVPATQPAKYFPSLVSRFPSRGHCSGCVIPSFLMRSQQIRPYRPTYRYLRGDLARQAATQAELEDTKKKLRQGSVSC